MFWGCSRLLPKLVDFADGNLDGVAGRRVEAHLARCTRCAEIVLELREVPGKVRRLAAPEPSPDFWLRQRQSVLDAIDGRTPTRPVALSARSGAGRWATPLALAASVAAMMVLTRWWAPDLRAPATGLVPLADVAEEGEASGTEEVSQVDALFSPDDASLLSLAEQLDDDTTTLTDETSI